MEMENTARDGVRYFTEDALKEKLAHSCIFTFSLPFTQSLNKIKDYKYIPHIYFYRIV